MQTFLPYANFERSAKCLDMKRLGKQRVECYTILRVLRGDFEAWRNHPAVKMWGGYQNALVHYGVLICHEWQKRGYKDQMESRIAAFNLGGTPLQFPRWFGWVKFHRSHQIMLWIKDPTHYEQFGFRPEPYERRSYIWPTKEKRG